MLKTVFKTFGVVLISGLVLACAACLISWKLLTGDPWAGLGVYVVFYFSYPIGLIIGIVLVKKLFKYKGSLLFGIVGFISGSVLVGLIIFILGPLRLIDALMSGWTTSPVYAAIGFILLFVVIPLSFASGYCLVMKSSDIT